MREDSRKIAASATALARPDAQIRLKVESSPVHSLRRTIEHSEQCFIHCIGVRASPKESRKMPMDPVLVWLHEIDEAANAGGDGRRAGIRASADHLLKNLPPGLSPTSPMGAAPLVRAVADAMPVASPYSRHRLEALAQRLETGQRSLADLVCLRHMLRQMKGSAVSQERHLASLLSIAVLGIARPLLIHRAAHADGRAPLR
jgi:hypothetical protein